MYSYNVKPNFIINGLEVSEDVIKRFRFRQLFLTHKRECLFISNLRVIFFDSKKWPKKIFYECCPPFSPVPVVADIVSERATFHIYLVLLYCTWGYGEQLTRGRRSTCNTIFIIIIFIVVFI